MLGDTFGEGALLAEDAFAHTPLWPGQEREIRGGCVLVHSPNPFRIFGLAIRLRFEDDPDAEIDEVRAWFAARGREEFTWLVSDSATPSDLAERLLERGARPDPVDPDYAAMVLRDEPPAMAGLEVRPVASLAEFAASRELAWNTIGLGGAEREEARNRLAEAWADYQGVESLVFAVFDDGGHAVSCGGMNFTPLGAYLAGANTHPAHRGRGCYRAVVRARWDAAVERGTPLLAVQAGRMSTPILERLGFERTGTVHAFVDRTRS